MNNKIFYQIALFILSILCCVAGLIYSIDGCNIINEFNKDGYSASIFFEVIICVLSCICMIVAVFALICSFYYENKAVYNVFKILTIVNIILLCTTAILLFVYLMISRISINKLNEIVYKEDGLALESFTATAMSRYFVLPATISCIVSEIMSIISFAIYSNDQQTFEVELVEEVENKPTTTSPAELTLEDKIKDLENKIKEKQLLKKYDELLHKLEEE